MYNVYCILYTVKVIVYPVLRPPTVRNGSGEQCVSLLPHLYSVQCALYSVHCTLYSVHFTPAYYSLYTGQ